MKRGYKFAITLIVVLAFLNAMSVDKAGSETGDVLWSSGGVKACYSEAGQSVASLVPDDKGGAFIFWYDNRSGVNNIYAQRINDKGNLAWQRDGVAIRVTTSSTAYARAVKDGAGGAIIAWEDGRNGNPDVFAQRIDAAGNIKWQKNGVPVAVLGDMQGTINVVRDNAGGAIIVWHDYRNGNWDIYAQRINESGSPLWSVNGIPVVSLGSTQLFFIESGTYSTRFATPDGKGGCIVCWYDNRNGRWDLYAQRLNPSGVKLWSADGVPVCVNTVPKKLRPQAVSDGNGGALIAYEESNNDGNEDLYLVKLSDTGNATWRVAVCRASGASIQANVASDGDGGAVLVWMDNRSGNYDIYAQKVDKNGNVLWAENGIPVVMAEGGQIFPQIVPGKGGEFIISYIDNPNNAAYVQKLDDKGRKLWGSKGLKVSGNSVLENSAAIGCTSDSGSAIFAWTDKRDGNNDVYAQKVGVYAPTLYFAEGCTYPGFYTFLCLSNPNDYGVNVTVTYMLKDGSTKTQNLNLPAKCRASVNAEGMVGAGKEFSIKVTPKEGMVVAERPMYFNYGGSWPGGTCVMGSPTPSKTFYFAEGCTRPGFNTYLCLSNPNASPATVDIYYYCGDGQTVEKKGILVGARSRYTVAVHDAREGIGTHNSAHGDVSIKVSSNLPILAERPMYFNYAGWKGGSCVQGAPAPSKTFYFAEGTTRVGFDEYLTLQNPNSSPATANITYYIPGGVTVKEVNIGPRSRVTISVVKDLGRGTQGIDHSIRITSDIPIVAERPMYYLFNGMDGGDCVMGWSR